MTFGISQLENRDWEFKGDVKVRGRLAGNGNRYFLEEYFQHTPGLNADLASATEATRVPRNRDFEVLGTNATSALVTFGTVDAGNILTTAGADDDQIIILPHLDTAQTAWAGVLWGTENQVEWECCIRTGTSIATVLIWAGLKLTNTPTIATDADQVYFRFSTDDSNTTWRCISSIGNSDTNTDSGITVAASTVYRFKIKILSSRSAEFYINDVFITRTAALTNDVNFIPYVGIQALGVGADNMTLAYEKISRIIFE